MTVTQEHPSINRQIWNLMIDAEGQYRYFYTKADMYRRRSRWINMSIFLGSLVAATFLFLKLDVTWAFLATAGLFYLIAILTVLEMFLQLSKNAGIAENVSRQCQIIGSESKRLWRTLDLQNDTDLVVASNELETRLSIATHVDIDYDDKLNKRCEQNARIVISEEFGGTYQDVSSEAAVAEASPRAAVAHTSA